MAIAQTRYPTGWVLPLGALGEPVPEGTTVDAALDAAVKLSGSLVAALQHPEKPLWWIFGDERMAVVELGRMGFTTRAMSYSSVSMHDLHTQLESLGWEQALAQA